MSTAEPRDNNAFDTAEGPVRLVDRNDQRAAILALLRQTRRTLCIYTRDLDPPLYDRPDIEQAISYLARHSRQSHIRILLQDATRAVKEGHRLVSLAQRLTSRVEIRRPAPHHLGHNEAFLVADERGLIHRPQAVRYEGIADFNDPLSARRLMRYFNQVWEHAAPDPQLRRLYL